MDYGRRAYVKAEELERMLVKMSSERSEGSEIETPLKKIAADGDESFAIAAIINDKGALEVHKIIGNNQSEIAMSFGGAVDFDVCLAGEFIYLTAVLCSRRAFILRLDRNFSVISGTVITHKCDKVAVTASDDAVMILAGVGSTVRMLVISPDLTVVTDDKAIVDYKKATALGFVKGDNSPKIVVEADGNTYARTAMPCIDARVVMNVRIEISKL